MDNIDFEEIVFFTLPQKQDQEDQNKTVDDKEFLNPVEENAEENAEENNTPLIAFICLFAFTFVFCLFAFTFAKKKQPSQES